MGDLMASNYMDGSTHSNWFILFSELNIYFTK